jgi:hypothetical protein
MFLPFLKLAEVFAKDGMSFLASCQNLLSRPWVIDDLDAFKNKWTKKSWEKVNLLFHFELFETARHSKWRRRPNIHPMPDFLSLHYVLIIGSVSLYCFILL